MLAAVKTALAALGAGAACAAPAVLTAAPRGGAAALWATERAPALELWSAEKIRSTRAPIRSPSPAMSMAPRRAAAVKAEAAASPRCPRGSAGSLDGGEHRGRGLGCDGERPPPLAGDSDSLRVRSARSAALSSTSAAGCAGGGLGGGPQAAAPCRAGVRPARGSEERSRDGTKARRAARRSRERPQARLCLAPIGRRAQRRHPAELLSGATGGRRQSARALPRTPGWRPLQRSIRRQASKPLPLAGVGGGRGRRCARPCRCAAPRPGAGRGWGWSSAQP